MEKKILWWARGGLIARMGPYATHAQAVRALRTFTGEPIEGAFVWPEEEEDTEDANEAAGE